MRIRSGCSLGCAAIPLAGAGRLRIAGLREDLRDLFGCCDGGMAAIECAREETAPHGCRNRGWCAGCRRARREALETVARPITAIQVAAFACAMVLMGAHRGDIELVSGRAEVGPG